MNSAAAAPSVSSQESKPAKAPRKSKAASVASKPNFFLKLPDEILARVFSFVDFDDLYALSCVDKQFHALLAGQNGHRAWENELAKEPSLTLKAAWNPLKMAFLLIGAKHCYSCGKRTTCKPDLFLRALYCKSCSNANTVPEKDISKSFKTGEHLHPLTVFAIFTDNPSLRHLLERIKSLNSALWHNFPVPPESTGRWDKSNNDWEWRFGHPSEENAVNRPLTRLAAFLYDTSMYQRALLADRVEINSWLSARREALVRSRVIDRLARLGLAKSLLIDTGATEKQTQFLMLSNAPEALFKAPLLSRKVFDGLRPQLFNAIRSEMTQYSTLPTLEATIKPPAEEPIRDPSQVAQLRREAALIEVHKRYMNTPNFGILKLPLNLFLLLPNIQARFQTDDDATTEEVFAAAWPQAWTCATNCQNQIYGQLKVALAQMAIHVPHVAIQHWLNTNGPIAALSNAQLAQLIKWPTCGMSFISSTQWTNNQPDGTAFDTAIWTDVEVVPGLRGLHGVPFFNSIEQLPTLVRGFGIKTAEDWIKPDKSLIVIHPRHLLGQLLAEHAFREALLTDAQRLEALSIFYGSRWCGQCGFFVEHCITHFRQSHLYRHNPTYGSKGEPDDASQWRVQSLPRFRFLPPPTHVYD